MGSPNHYKWPPSPYLGLPVWGGGRIEEVRKCAQAWPHFPNEDVAILVLQANTRRREGVKDNIHKGDRETYLDKYSLLNAIIVRFITCLGSDPWIHYHNCMCSCVCVCVCLCACVRMLRVCIVCACCVCVLCMCMCELCACPQVYTSGKVQLKNFPSPTSTGPPSTDPPLAPAPPLPSRHHPLITPVRFQFKCTRAIVCRSHYDFRNTVVIATPLPPPPHPSQALPPPPSTSHCNHLITPTLKGRGRRGRGDDLMKSSITHCQRFTCFKRAI